MCHSECVFYLIFLKTDHRFYLAVQEDVYVLMELGALSFRTLSPVFCRNQRFSSGVGKHQKTCQLWCTSCRIKAVKLKVVCLHSPGFSCFHSFTHPKLRKSISGQLSDRKSIDLSDRKLCLSESIYYKTTQISWGWHSLVA